MKYIALFLFILFSSSLFSQSEIWGLKEYDGLSKGGFIYTIDSATKNVIIQHRFLQLYNYDEDLDNVTPEIHSSTGDFISISGSYLIKYNPSYQTNSFKVLGDRPFGRFCAVNDSLWYVLRDRGLFKINPITMKVDSIEGYKAIFYTADGGPIMINDSTIIWSQIVEAYGGVICKLDLRTDEISILYNMDELIDAQYFPTGSLIPYGGKYYGITYQYLDSKKYLLIYSYDVVTGIFQQEYKLENKYILRDQVNGLARGDDDKLYSVGQISKSDRAFYVFSFNPINSVFDSIGPIDESIGTKPYGTFIKDKNGILYGSCLEDGLNDDGGIFTFKPATKEIDLLYAFDTLKSLGIKKNLVLSPQEDFMFISFKMNNYRRVTIDRLNIDGSGYEHLSDLNHIYGNNKGSYPFEIQQLVNDKIIGVCKSGGVYNIDNGGDGSGVLFEFDSRNKQYSVLHQFDDLDYRLYPSDLFILSNNRVLGLLRSTIDDVPSSKYVFDLNTNTYTQLNDFPWMKYEESAQMIGDSMMYSIVSDNGNSPFQLVKYNVFTDDMEVLIECDENTEISNLEQLDEQQLVFQEVVDVYDDLDSTFLTSYNFQNNIFQRITNLNQFSYNGDNNIVRFDFKVSENNTLVGRLKTVPITKDDENQVVWLNSFAKYDIIHDVMIKLQESSYIADNDWGQYSNPNYIESYEGGDSYLASVEKDYDNFKGVLLDVDFYSKSVDTLLFFETPSIGSLYTGDVGVSGLKKFRKTDYYNHWIGKVNSSWHDSENWLSGMVPDTTSEVCIDAFTPFDLVIDTLVKVKKIIVTENAKLEVSEMGSLSVLDRIINNGSISLKGNSKQKASLIENHAMEDFGSCDYYYSTDSTLNETLASPVESSGFQYSDLYDISSFSSSEFEWNPEEQFPYYPSPTDAHYYKGSNKDIDFNGTFNTGDFNLEIPLQTEEQLFPIVNPYPSSLDWTQLDLSNLSHQALYRFHASDSTYSAFVDGLGFENPLIQPLDVFWVSSEGNESMKLKNDDRIHASQYIEEVDEERNQLVLQAKGAGGVDRAMISFNPESSSSFEGNKDAIKYSLTYNDRPQIFTKANDYPLVINQLQDTAMMDLFVEAGVNGNYTISIDKNIGFDYLVLEDLIWKTRHNLLEEDYSFDYFTSDGDYPFKLYFSEWGTQPVEAGDIQIYYYPESIVVRSSKQIEQAIIVFYDLMGRPVLEFNEQDFHYFEHPVSLPVGHYIVQLRSKDVVVNTKVLVRH
ncbi:hypothetical protein [Lentimicrobium sp. S6]|uniref:hypothetical protein n=1 Tax=Lentimicrobium sp. S6 TaxID=2735872 RepID=UPI0015562EBA|nr:hypothetical protein [Lentimicrobium sp. S6]NPD45806.1 hypothetical protein [Lentimicrobium sp. S6]